jgi:coenzyme F420-reducing hydrogenase gamma subunit
MMQMRQSTTKVIVALLALIGCHTCRAGLLDTFERALHQLEAWMYFSAATSPAPDGDLLAGILHLVHG